MASSIPDVATLTSSAQIFSSNKTLPQIRAIHKALHVQVEEKSSRLRTQVGSSYRELLGTADTIVQMHGDNDHVQELLGKIGGRCGRAVVAAKATGLAKFVANERNEDMSRAARLKLLSGCGLLVGRILKGQVAGLEEHAKRGDRLLLAAKVWVLIRLLLKGFEEEADGVSGTPKLDLGGAFRSRDSLRRRLNSAIKKVIENASDDAEREDILKALCAHCLVASSGASDALRYFLSARAEAMALAFDVEGDGRATTTEDVVHSLRLYTKTILDVQALVPAKLSPVLASLKSRPLLADPALKHLEGLRLDLYHRWCSEELQYFTPFVRHDDLDGKLARERLTSWATKGGQVLLDGLRKTLEHMADFKSIMELRTEVLQLWIRDGGRARGFDPSDMQDDLRDAINSRMLAVLETKVTKLRLVGSEVRATLEGWREGFTDKQLGLWNESGYDEALAAGAASFVQEVTSRLYGRNDAVSKAAHSYSSWYHVIDDVEGVVELLRKQRWDNDYDEIEDEETIEARQQALSKDDPRRLQEKLDATLDTSFEELQQQLGKLWEEKADSTTNGAVAMYLVRVLRDIRAGLPDRPSIKSFGLSMVPELHSKIVTSVSAQALGEFIGTFLSSRRVPGRALWEGEPALPIQPSPGLFQFLQELSLSMTDAGVDLWTPVAVVAMKKHLCERLCESWRKELATLAAEPSDQLETKKKDSAKGKEAEKEEEKELGQAESQNEKDSELETASAGDQIRDVSTQWHFDVAFLGCSVGTISGTTSEGLLKKLEDDLYELSGVSDESSRQRITKAAQDYWHRTSLLFGLLA
ncbi:hypothetical protein JDV02_007376 [Purpureocillium takamizusanense]|uniref:Conserved oligomeric Golgi complex subunit 1 n=1 Tax=Purpureocillium takamizusanense TaxID=2060973 RepID=A0A9Q8VDN7_9HYPO|nr:uncharacterized protein JDV02_007376 [Purpureocillium takamizusanense]UNI21381.1 hypothetical protein JDV02_007376 [Purpureocillium takamizusanense]